MSFSVVAKVVQIVPHPNADKLDVLTLLWTDGPSHTGGESFDMVKVVTGKHYREGQLGVYIRPGCLIPGWLAEDLWLLGTQKAHEQWFEVRTIKMRGIESPGLFCGETYQKDYADPRSLALFDKRLDVGRDVGEDTIAIITEDEFRGIIKWPYWRKHWKVGDVLDNYLGIIP